MCNCNSKKDPKSSKNDKAKKEVTCKPTNFVLTFNGKYNDGSRKSVSVIFKSTPPSPPCTYPAQTDYNNAFKNLIGKWNGEQLKLAKKYKAAGKAAPKLTKKSTSLVCPSVGGTSCSGNKCSTSTGNYCCYSSKSSCESIYGICYECDGSSSCWYSVLE